MRNPWRRGTKRCAYLCKRVCGSMQPLWRARLHPRVRMSRTQQCHSLTPGARDREKKSASTWPLFELTDTASASAASRITAVRGDL